jgi:hypothetical protein
MFIKVLLSAAAKIVFDVLLETTTLVGTAATSCTLAFGNVIPAVPSIVVDIVTPVLGF